MPTATLQRLSASHRLPTVGAPVHVNHPRHDGDTPLHDHDFLELALVTAGYAVHRTVHGEQPVAVGDLFILHPGQWHAYERCRGLELYNCCVGTALLAHEMLWAVQDPHLGMVLPNRVQVTASNPIDPHQGVLAVNLTPDETAICTTEMTRIRELLSNSDPVHVRGEIIAHVLLLLSRVAQRLAATKPIIHAVYGSIPPTVVQAQQLMEERIAHPWGLEELAASTGITRFHLVRLFHRHMGCPPMAWLSRRRVEKAAVLLLTSNLSMAQVGQRIGWDDPNYFSRRFRSAFGRSPREYRAQLPMPAVVVDSTTDWVQW